MKVKFGAIITSGSGKVGGHVVSRNKGGAYMRTKGIATNPNTSAQQVARALLSTLSSQWSTLSESQRLSWNDAVAEFAKTDIFGDIKNPSGINLFIKLNCNLANGNLAQIVNPPAKLDVPFAQVTGMSYSLATADLTVSGDMTPYDGVTLIVSATPTLSDGVSFVKNRLRNIGTTSDLSDLGVIPILYSSKFGVPSIGDNIFIGLQPIVASGQKGVVQLTKVSVVA